MAVVVLTLCGKLVRHNMSANAAALDHTNPVAHLDEVAYLDEVATNGAASKKHLAI